MRQIKHKVPASCSDLPRFAHHNPPPARALHVQHARSTDIALHAYVPGRSPAYTDSIMMDLRRRPRAAARMRARGCMYCTVGASQSCTVHTYTSSSSSARAASSSSSSKLLRAALALQAAGSVLNAMGGVDALETAATTASASKVYRQPVVSTL